MGEGPTEQLEIRFRAVAPQFVSLRRKRSESRMLEIGTSGLMSGGGKRGGGSLRQYPRPSSTLPVGRSLIIHRACYFPAGDNTNVSSLRTD